MRNVKKFDFTVEAGCHQYIFGRVEADTAYYALVLMSIVGVDQFLEIEFTTFENT